MKCARNLVLLLNAQKMSSVHGLDVLTARKNNVKTEVVGLIQCEAETLTDFESPKDFSSILRNRRP